MSQTHVHTHTHTHTPPPPPPKRPLTSYPRHYRKFPHIGTHTGDLMPPALCSHFDFNLLWDPNSAGVLYQLCIEFEYCLLNVLMLFK